MPTSSRVTVNLARLVNRRRVKPSNNQRPDGLAQYALNIIRERYTDFGRCWRVKSLQNCTMSTCTKKLSGRLWLKPVSRSPANNVRRKFSNRLACCGELIQIDGCDHHWFENRAPDCTALVYVDDATSHLMQLRFVKSESTFTYFEAIRGYLEKQDHIIRWRKGTIADVRNRHAMMVTFTVLCKTQSLPLVMTV